MSTAAIIEKVQKLLALSQSQNANEAAAAAAAANKLIDQYRLSESDLEVQGQAEEPVEEAVELTEAELASRVPTLFDALEDDEDDE